MHGFEQLAGDLVDRSAKGNFRALGKRFGKQTPVVAAAIAAADARALAESLRASGTATVVLDGAEVEVSAEDVLLTETPREGWAVVTEGGETVALDLTLTPELRRAGLAREVVRLVQEARKSAGFEVTDRVALRVVGRGRARRRRCGSTPRPVATRSWRSVSRRGSRVAALTHERPGPRADASPSPVRRSEPVKIWS